MARLGNRRLPAVVRPLARVGAVSTEPVIVEPGREDPIAAQAVQVIGGPMGQFANRMRRWWTPVRVLLVMAALSYAVGYVLDLSCRKTGWLAPERYEHLCYSDIPPLYALRGFADGYLPYLQTPPGGQPLEYPVLTGVFMQIAAVITRALTGLFGELPAGRTFFDVNVILLFIPFAIAVVALALTVRRRPWDAAMLALAPTVILAATINWDLLPLAFAGTALVLWARSRPFAAGLLLGLAIAAKFYPLLFLGVFALLALRTARWRAFGSLLLGTAIAWLVVNVPFMLANFDGWWYFYSFSQTRGVDFGSFWFAMTQLGMTGVPAELLNKVASGAFILLCIAIAVLALAAPRRPRLAQLLFLVVAAFAITNKVYSPQYVLWLIPLAILARPRWRDVLIWQAGEIVYFVAIWWFLVGYGSTDENIKGMTPQWYGIATLVHIGVTVWFAALVVRDILRPAHDPVRSDEFVEDDDDPAGGVFDHAPDVVRIGRQ